MTEIEKKAVLALKPYFSKYPIVFDVGSNKGEWSDTIVHNVSELHLFEPNARLLTYTMVKYDYLTNVHYNNVAVFSESKVLDFFYFNNNNNGLSSVFYNQFWVDQGLPMRLGNCMAITLDSYKPHIKNEIDFIKIDVEGADLDVLIGSTQLLKHKRIKFLSIEVSDHYQLSGHSFSEVGPFVRQFGYDLFHFDGVNFVKYTNQEAENVYIMDKDFTQNWNGEFIKNTKGIKVDFALEIGCFEGLTSTYICDNLLNPGGRIICIDPLTEEYLPGHEDNEMFKGQYERFIRNTRTYPVELLRMTSEEAFKLKGFSDYRFGLIYIDGDHRREQVYKDGAMAITVARPGGYILFDDYEWREETKQGIDAFLRDFAGYFTLISKGYQVLIQRNNINN